MAVWEVWEVWEVCTGIIETVFVPLFAWERHVPPFPSGQTHDMACALGKFSVACHPSRILIQYLSSFAAFTDSDQGSRITFGAFVTHSHSVCH